MDEDKVFGYNIHLSLPINMSEETLSDMLKKALKHRGIENYSFNVEKLPEPAASFNCAFDKE